MADSCHGGAVAGPARFVLQILVHLGKVPSARFLHCLCYTAQHLGVRRDQTFRFRFIGGEPFSTDIDLALGALQCNGLVLDTGGPNSLLPAERAASVVEPIATDVAPLAALGLPTLADAARVLFLQEQGIPGEDIPSCAKRRFLMEEAVARRTLQTLEGLRA